MDRVMSQAPEFILMNKDTPIASIVVYPHDTYINSFYTQNIPPDMRDVSAWVNSRTSPVGRKNIRELLKMAGIRNKQEFVTITHAISLNDTFWVKEKDSKLTWDKISPYRNRFSRVISEIALNCRYIGTSNIDSLHSPSPDYTVEGSTEKCWKRENGGIVLYKTEGERWSGITGGRPYSEYYASQVANALIEDKSHFISYGIKVAKTRDNGYNKAYCYSSLFTSEQFGYLAYENSKYRDYTLDELDTMLKNRNRDRMIIRELLLLDSLILNYDRHMGNYGFMFDNDTFKMIGIAPIFDQDCSLGHFVSLQSVDSMSEAYQLALQKQPRTNMGNYIQQARWALTNQLKTNLSLMYPFHFKRLPKEVDLEDERIQFMEYIVNNQIRAILGR